MRGRKPLSVAVALFVGAVGVTAATAGLDASSISLGPDATRPRPPAGYNFKAEFGLGLEVNWEEHTGTRGGPCPDWQHTKGKLEIDAGSVDTKKTRFTIPGRMSIYPRPRKDAQTGLWNWADPTTAGLGNARATIKVTLIQEGRVCVNGVSKPWIPPQNDCAGAKTYLSRATGIRPVLRRGFRTLDDLTGDSGTVDPNRQFQLDALGIDVPPLRAVYRNCYNRPEGHQIPIGLSQYPVNLAIRVEPDHVRKLRALRSGRLQRIPERGVQEWSGHCGEDTIAENCTFEFEIFVDIRRS